MSHLQHRATTGHSTAFPIHRRSAPPVLRKSYIFVISYESKVNFLQQIVDSRPGRAEVHPLGLMDLEAASERNKLLAFLRNKVPATIHVADEKLIGLIGGYPGVVYRWVDSPTPLRSYDDLGDLAAAPDGINTVSSMSFYQLAISSHGGWPCGSQ